jgi:hypothetical protein
VIDVIKDRTANGLQVSNLIMGGFDVVPLRIVLLAAGSANHCHGLLPAFGLHALGCSTSQMSQIALASSEM